MLTLMPSRKKTPGKALKNPEQVLVRMDAATQAALADYIAAQKVPPERPTVALVALRLFLEAEGFLKTPKPPK